MTSPTLLVLAAGMGSRYGGLKQLDAMGPHGETIMDYSVYDACRAGFGKVVFVIRREMEEAFRAGVGDRYADEVEVAYAFQRLDDLPGGFSPPEGREKPWGTGHAVWAAREAVREPFAVINADDFYGADAYRVMADFLRRAEDGPTPDFSMVGYTLRNTLSPHGTVSRGVCHVDGDGMLDHIVETLGIRLDGDAVTAQDPGDADATVALTGDELVSLNLWGFTPSFFEHLERLFVEFLETRRDEPKAEFYLPFAVNDLIQAARARVRVLASDARWFGVTYREDKDRTRKQLAALVAAGDYPAPLRGAGAP